MAKDKLKVEGKEVSIEKINGHKYISLTDIAKQAGSEPRYVIQNWLSNQKTILYLFEWEKLHNKNFNRVGFDTVKDLFFENPFKLSPKKWIDETNAIGIVSRSGRYGGGTYAHSDIALNFCYWLSPKFQVYLIKEFQALQSSRVKPRQWSAKKIFGNLQESINLLEAYHLNEEE